MVKYVLSIIMCIMISFSIAGCVGFKFKDRTPTEDVLIESAVRIAGKHFVVKMCDRSSPQHIQEFATIVDQTMLALDGDIVVVINDAVLEKFNEYLCEEVNIDDLLASDIEDLIKMCGLGARITVDTNNETVERVVSKTKNLLEGFQAGLKLNVCSNPE